MTTLTTTIRSLLKNSRNLASNIIESHQLSPSLLQNNKTDYEIVIREGLMSLRHYYPLQEAEIDIESRLIPVEQTRYSVPLVLIPPLGVYAWIFDLIPQRSLVKFMLAKGFDVYLIDWGDPTPENANISLEDYVLRWMPFALRAVQSHSQQTELSLLGYCMGGLLALMYLGIEKDDKVRNLVTLASPIDFHHNGLIGEVLALLAKPTLKAHEFINSHIAKLNKTQLHVPGRLISSLLKLTNPAGSLLNQWKFIRHLNDREFIKRHLSIGQWFNNMADFPGYTTQQMIEKFALGNQMAAKTLSIGRKHVELNSISCNLLSIAGSNDSIVSVSSARLLMKLVSSRDKRFSVIKAGHAGIFAGSKAPELVWETCAQWLSLRSGINELNTQTTGSRD